MKNNIVIKERLYLLSCSKDKFIDKIESFSVIKGEKVSESDKIGKYYLSTIKSDYIIITRLTKINEIQPNYFIKVFLYFEENGKIILKIQPHPFIILRTLILPFAIFLILILNKYQTKSISDFLIFAIPILIFIFLSIIAIVGYRKKSKKFIQRFESHFNKFFRDKKFRINR